ncbi:zinc finger CCCH domain-containing protein 15 [Humulus lupulus]|uniref:zinc finger CCCH domain-containing protein 15 n=1 Tax=Humulus lupulus TaxID=3486 RepID=UPI002B40AC55|nr:zinc finger CCCH domain-containing protein 15 [Humulus lupulus]
MQKYSTNGVVSSNSFFLGDDEFDSDSSITAVAVDDHRRRLYNSLLVQDRQEMVNRRSLCLNRLRQVSVEVTSLRTENSHLRSINVELNKQFRLLFQSALQNRLGSRSVFSEKGFGDGLWNRDQEELISREERQRTSPIEHSRPKKTVEAIDICSRLPKSISVKSEDYLKVSAQAFVKNGGRSRDSSRSRTSATLQNIVKQKVNVGGGKKKENHGGDPVELDVYKQGALKTEICNKWQETGECPYGDHCQFAHGVEELRPVIRHPRYKTQVCRMVLNGVVCPYGHRCHFLHALPPRDHKVK